MVGLCLVFVGMFVPGCQLTQREASEAAKDVAGPDAKSVAVECSLSPADYEERVATIHGLVTKYCHKATEIEDGYTLEFAGGGPVRAQVLAIAELEKECCPFLAWDISPADNQRFTVRVVGPPEAKPILADFARVAKEVKTLN